MIVERSGVAAAARGCGIYWQRDDVATLLYRW